MYKYLAITGLLVISSTSAIAADSPSKESSPKEVKEVSLLERLFTTKLYLCDAYPDCDIDGDVDESEQMARDLEKEKQPYQDSKSKTQTNSQKEG